MALLRITLLALLIVAANSKIYDPCELFAKIKQVEGLDGIKGYTAEDYVCTIHYISGYNTSLRGSNTDFGIIQASSKWWCDDYITEGRKNMCGVPCSNLLNDDITDDLECFKRILRDPNGLEAWLAWKDKCEGTDTSRFTKKCK